MSEVPPHNPNEDKLQDFRGWQARKLDTAEAASLYQQMADRFQAEGDNERAKRYRELAKMTIEEDRKEKNSPSGTETPQREDLTIKKVHEQPQTDIANGRRLNTIPDTIPPTDWKVQARIFSPEEMKAIQRAIKVAKANQPMQRQVKPPETK